jgi:hypothetical protein
MCHSAVRVHWLTFPSKANVMWTDHQNQRQGDAFAVKVLRLTSSPNWSVPFDRKNAPFLYGYALTKAQEHVQAFAYAAQQLSLDVLGEWLRSLFPLPLLTRGNCADVTLVDSFMFDIEMPGVTTVFAQKHIPMYDFGGAGIRAVRQGHNAPGIVPDVFAACSHYVYQESARQEVITDFQAAYFPGSRKLKIVDCTTHTV